MKIHEPAVPLFSRSSLIDECSRDLNKKQPVSPLFHQVFEGGLVVESIPSRFLCNLDEGFERSKMILMMFESYPWAHVYICKHVI